MSMQSNNLNKDTKMDMSTNFPSLFSSMVSQFIFYKCMKHIKSVSICSSSIVTQYSGYGILWSNSLFNCAVY